MLPAHAVTTRLPAPARSPAQTGELGPPPRGQLGPGSRITSHVTVMRSLENTTAQGPDSPGMERGCPPPRNRPRGRPGIQGLPSQSHPPASPGRPPSRLPGAASPTRWPSGQRLAPPGRVRCGVPRALLRLQPHLPGWGSGDFLGRSRRLDSIHERGCSFGGSDSHLTPYCNFPINCDLNKLKWLTRLSSR